MEEDPMNHSIAFWEELQSNAFPALQTIFYDGWSVRFGGGFTYRVNCANPMYPGSLPAEEKINYVEQCYAKSGLDKVIFKLHDGMGDEAAACEAILDRRGYASERSGNVFVCDLTAQPVRSTEGVVLETTPTDDWLGQFLDMNGTSDPMQRDAAFKMLKNIWYPTIAASIVRDGKMVACGLGVVERGCVGLYDIFVDPACRRQHLGDRLCAAIMEQGRTMGCHTAYLQVLTDNTAARRLYAGLGFREDYHYWFRLKKFPENP
jgi:ribosomal protein S18 acetylase RimI-like enzyme